MATISGNYMETVSMKAYSLYSGMRKLEREFLMEFWIWIPREKKSKSMRVIRKIAKRS